MKILIVEDDDKIYELVKEKFEQWSFEVAGVEDFQKVMEVFIAESPELVILDVNLPVYDGFYWCQQIRTVSKTPIVFLSSREHPMDIVMAMNVGADDYIQKPFNLDVLVAKVQALLRRTYSYGDTISDVIDWNGAVLDLKKGSLHYNDQEIHLTKNEFFILRLLLEERGKIVSREELMRRLWEDEKFVSDNTLSVNITRIRTKLEDIGLNDKIVTKKGQGYLVN
ncbi:MULTISPECIES: response regulator transcription factor [Priestia]|jgi:OmpR family two-component system bacitracin resistance response regulator BceR|uniref:Two-component response regulator, BceR-like protein n=3 Tax=Priestia TaxID=2800373 RepID=D5E378_PRIM1|nr:MULTISPECIES: response regulator transcription factor [Priestia]AVX09787.1 DNA-binding response regulator [Bacillus sp. Y-01]KOP75891.1 transcriptional regulator [Bacillus sp. FJAT-21351]KQU22721.1 two-component system response regulator [Bacillus sp. Leaf75]KRF57196.1 two-component system response regulator [Bacillus sp. Soil531]MCF6797755.1 response regulator transcription factor [Bacillus sp. ET1]MDH6653121.1 OmpR family two-component system bacitracin resistance response regulator BceR